MNKLSITSNEKMFEFLANNPDFGPLIEFVSSNLPEFPSLVLDFGCQKTALLETLESLGCNIVGIDTFDAESLPPSEFSFDEVTNALGDRNIDAMYSILGLSSFAIGADGFDRIVLNKIADIMNDDSKVILVLPYGQPDDLIQSYHRFYNQESMGILLSGFQKITCRYLIRNIENRIWIDVNEEIASQTISNLHDGLKSVVLITAEQYEISKTEVKR